MVDDRQKTLPVTNILASGGVNVFD